MENFDKWWGVAATVGGIVAMLITTIVAAVSDFDDGDPTNDPMWQKVLRGIALVLTRIFGVSTFANKGNKRGFELKLPIAQSAAPKKKTPQ